MSFKDTFENYVCLGDKISCEVNGYTVTARIAHDDTPDRPDQRQDGFWPSLIKTDAGFIGRDKTLDDFMREQAKAQTIMDAWKADKWFYCGVILSVRIEDVELTDHAASLWGIEANYPDSDNAYLSEVANELLGEALSEARKERARQCRILCLEPSVSAA